MSLSLELIDTFWGFSLSSFFMLFIFPFFIPFSFIFQFFNFLPLTPYFLVVCYSLLFKSFKLRLLKRGFQRVTSEPCYLLIQIQINKPGRGIFLKFTKKPSEHTTDVILLSKLFPCFDLVSQLTCFEQLSTLCQSNRVSSELCRIKL